ncbi:Squalene epoxidase [Stygiomarasmius scandens]|uniref:Squalene monooxygenase n=1 Tax=Marasmiellus scandens TaxID=2682957 RepID=A0ABR1JR54_9AGAR
MSSQYDVLIVGAGIAGCSFAHALSTLKRQKPLRIALLERSLEEPDRIVGELLQPGGVMALKKLGLEHTLEGMDAIPVQGYCVVDNGKSVHIPYPGGHEGRSFHHGKFIMNLRKAASTAKGVEVIEATVTELLRCQKSNKVIGVSATRKDGEKETKESLHADLVVIADGCFSNFRTQVMGQRACKPVTKSHFVGLVLEDASLPYRYHGTVCLTKSAGPVLLYQIGTHDTRMLVDVQAPLPSDLKGHILNNIVPQLPSSLRVSVTAAINKDRLRRMPNSFLPPVQQAGEHSAVQGVFLLGDAWNMRHPLTGGGMTVAFNDVVILRDLLNTVEDLTDWSDIQSILHSWHWKRKPLSSTVNILSVALYDLFGADDEELEVLRTGCFKYFERGGDCVDGPVSLLSATIQSPAVLFYHFFSVAFYSIWVMFTHPQLVQRHKNEKPRLVTPTIVDYPALFFKSIRVIWTAIIVFMPLLWSEVRWWSPDDSRVMRNALVGLAIPVGVMLGLATTDFLKIGI